MWPDVGEIENVDLLLCPSLLGLLLRHDLDLHGPRREVSLLNGLVKVLLSVIVGLGSSLIAGKVLDPLVGDHVELGIDPLALSVDKLQSVSVVSVHESPSSWDTSITHENHDLVDRFWVLGKVVPESGGVVITRQVGSWVSLLCVDEVRELCWVSNWR